jgi:AraC-like DNA-binding protein
MREPRVLRPATGVDDFRLAPIDRYMPSDCWVAFYRTRLSGVVFWGRVNAKAVADLARLLPIRCQEPAVPHPSWVDTRFVESIDPDVFDVRASVFSEHAAAFVQFVTRVAVVHTGGIAGALIMGLHQISRPPFDEAFFEEPEQALRWLGCESEIGLLPELDHLRHEALGHTPFLRELRTVLDETPRLSLAEAARRQRVSERSLQRRLAEAGTTFQEELALATVRVAQRLLLTDNMPVTQVAMEVGCASPQHLATLFRKVVGDTPARWRERELARTGR